MERKASRRFRKWVDLGAALVEVSLFLFLFLVIRGFVQVWRFGLLLLIFGGVVRIWIKFQILCDLLLIVCGNVAQMYAYAGFYCFLGVECSFNYKF